MKRIVIFISILISCTFLAGCSSPSTSTNTSETNAPSQTSVSQSEVKSSPSTSTNTSETNAPSQTSVSQSEIKSSSSTSTNTTETNAPSQTPVSQSEVTNKYLTSIPKYIKSIYGTDMPITSYFDLSFYSDLDSGQSTSYELTFTRKLNDVYIICENKAKKRKREISSGATINANTSITIDLKHNWEWTLGDLLTIKAKGYHDFTYRLPINEYDWAMFTIQNIENTKIKMAKTGKSYRYMDPNGAYHDMQPGSVEASNYSATGGSSGSSLSISARSILKQQLQSSEKRLADMQKNYNTCTLETLKSSWVILIAKEERNIEQLKAKLGE